MLKAYYIAYGSNMSVEDMKTRAPDARIVGASMLNGWRLSLRKHATVEPCEGAVTPAVVWEISERDEIELDSYEDYPGYYYKKIIPVEVLCRDSSRITLDAMVYIMADGHPLRMPSPSYIECLRKGYMVFGFPLEILENAISECKSVEL